MKGSCIETFFPHAINREVVYTIKSKQNNTNISFGDSFLFSLFIFFCKNAFLNTSVLILNTSQCKMLSAPTKLLGWKDTFSLYLGILRICSAFVHRNSKASDYLLQSGSTFISPLLCRSCLAVWFSSEFQKSLWKLYGVGCLESDIYFGVSFLVLQQIIPSNIGNTALGFFFVLPS